MNMHLRTDFGVSTSFYASDLQTFQGVVQDNGEVPGLWLIISIFLIKCVHQQNIVTSIKSPISRLSIYLEAVLHVDDTELYLF